jgi:hypothetical protein
LLLRRYELTRIGDGDAAQDSYGNCKMPNSNSSRPEHTAEHFPQLGENLGLMDVSSCRAVELLVSYGFSE